MLGTEIVLSSTLIYSPNFWENRLNFVDPFVNSEVRMDFVRTEQERQNLIKYLLLYGHNNHPNRSGINNMSELPRNFETSNLDVEAVIIGKERREVIRIVSLRPTLYGQASMERLFIFCVYSALIPSED